MGNGICRDSSCFPTSNSDVFSVLWDVTFNGLAEQGSGLCFDGFQNFAVQVPVEVHPGDGKSDGLFVVLFMQF